MHTISNAVRFFFFVVASILWLGIWLTGSTTVHWLLYFVPAFFYFAAVTGIGPGLIFSRMLIPENKLASVRKRRKS